MDEDQTERVRRGIAAYRHEQAVMLRLLRKRGQFTALEFDNWLHGREWRRPRLSGQGIHGDSFILGGMDGSMWAKWLELLQYMVALGLVQQGEAGADVVYFESPNAMH